MIAEFARGGSSSPLLDVNWTVKRPKVDIARGAANPPSS
jgi:hypothetical protein